MKSSICDRACYLFLPALAAIENISKKSRTGKVNWKTEFVYVHSIYDKKNIKS